VSNELHKLGVPLLSAGFGRLRFEADISLMYRSRMALRTADRILLEAAVFPADNFDALFEGVRAIPFEDYIPRGMGLCVAKVRTKGSALQSEVSIQAVAHKAAAARLCTKWHMERLPETMTTADIRVYIEKDSASVLLDLSGEPLFKRGYRSEGGIAPLRETTAAAIILLSGWKRKFPLYDPFCGSGTIAIEAAMYAWDAAPGLSRTFAVSSLALADAAAEAAVRAELLAKVDFTRTVRIFGSDSDPRSVSMAKANMQRAYEIAQGKKPVSGMREEAALAFLASFKTLAMKEALPAASEAGFIITNPPYGKRLGEKSDAEAVYGAMAGMSRRFPAWKLGVITDHPGFESFFGKKADSCREITNGATASYFFQYDELERNL
jgi:putative N6-adenine-specific DNA methylase